MVALTGTGRPSKAIGSWNSRITLLAASAACSTLLSPGSSSAKSQAPTWMIWSAGRSARNTSSPMAAIRRSPSSKPNWMLNSRKRRTRRSITASTPPRCFAISRAVASKQASRLSTRRSAEIERGGVEPVGAGLGDRDDVDLLLGIGLGVRQQVDHRVARVRLLVGVEQQHHPRPQPAGVVLRDDDADLAGGQLDQRAGRIDAHALQELLDDVALVERVVALVQRLQRGVARGRRL